MVNATFVEVFGEHIQKQIGGTLAGAPAIHHGGVTTDQYRGLGHSVSSALAGQVNPFHKESYQATEYLYGWLPLRVQGLPYLYFQTPVVDIKGHSIPGVAQFATFFPSPIPSTLITPMVGFTNRWLPRSAFEEGDARPKDVFTQKTHWTPLLEALNNDKAATKAAVGKYVDCTMGKYKVEVDMGSAVGLTQMAPYRGYTIITAQRVPGLRAGVDKPVYLWEEIVEQFTTIASMAVRFPQQGEDIGQLIVSKSNATIMDYILKQIDSGVSRRQASQPAPQAAPAAAETFPCPQCSQPVADGAAACAACGLALVWG